MILKPRLISDFSWLNMIDQILISMFIIVLFFILDFSFNVHINVKQFLPECLNWEPKEQKEDFLFDLLNYYFFRNSTSRPTYYICSFEDYG